MCKFFKIIKNSQISISGVTDSYMKSLPTHKFAYTNGKVTNITEYGTDGTKGSTASKGGKVTVDSSAATEEEGYYQYLGTTSLKDETLQAKIIPHSFQVLH